MVEDIFNFGGGILAFLLFVWDVIVIMQIIESKRDVPSKLAWCALIFFFPIFGILFYYALGHHKKHLHHSEYAPIV